MRIFITGVAGFIGSALANKLIQEEHYVRGIDDLSTGDPNRLSSEVEFIRGDINDRPKLWTLLQDVDVVFHTAARVVVPESILYPRDYNQVNVGGTVTLMEAIRDVGVKRVVFTSSGAIYGNHKAQPVKETATLQPRSPYAVSKLSAEYYIQSIGGLCGIETVCLRIFNTYGPGQPTLPTHPPVIPYFLKQAFQNSTIVINGDGNQTRDYVYIDDVVNGLKSTLTAKNIDRQIINIGSGRETSVRELAKIVMEITGRNPQIIYNFKSDGGPSRMCADITKARDMINFHPLTPLEIGLQNTFEKELKSKSKI